jgi:5'-nucleotidase
MWIDTKTKTKRALLTTSVITVSIAATASCSSLRPDRGLASEKKKARIIALTDFHGALESDSAPTKVGQTVTFGGAALLSSYIDRIRSQDQVPTFIIDAGDLFQGTLISNSVEGSPVINFYNFLGVDAVAIGNHDFDYGPSGENVIAKKPGEDPRGALKARMKQARFPFLAANIRGAENDIPKWVKPSVLIERGGVKVGVIGIASPQTRDTTLLKNVEDLTFTDPVAPIIVHSRRLREQGADFIVLTAHSGGGCKDNSEDKQSDLSSCNKSELFDVVQALPQGTIDLAVGGHTHQGIAKYVKGVPVLQNFSRGSYVEWAELSSGSSQIHSPVRVCGEQVMTAKGPSCEVSDIKQDQGQVVAATFMGSPITANPRVSALLKRDFERVQAIKDAPLGVKIETAMNRDYYDENLLGNFMSDVYAEYFKNQIDLVLLNNGGFRDNLVPGELKYGHVFTVLPFDNKLAIVTVDGKTLRRIVEIGISRKDGGMSWSGLTFQASQCKTSEILVHEAPLDDQKSYRILMPDFVAMGGVGISTLGLKPSQIQILEELPVMRDVMADAIKKNRPKTDNPKTYLDPEHPRQKIATICGG